MPYNPHFQIRPLFQCLLLLFPFICLQQKTWGQQKHCDLSLRIISPTQGEEIPYGDTVKMFISVKNLGPDAIDSSDQFNYIMDNGSPFTLNITDVAIPVGDSFVYDAFETVNGQEDTDYHLYFCSYLDTQYPQSTVADTDQANDSACLDAILKAHHPNGIAETIRPFSSISIYPNPSEGKAVVRFVSTTSGRGELEVRDILGRTLWQRSYHFKKGQNEYRLDVHRFSPGLYFVSLRDSSGNRYIRKMVIGGC